MTFFINPYNAKIALYKPCGPKGFFQYEVIITVLVIENLCYWYTANIILLIRYVEFWRLKTVPVLKGLTHVGVWQ